MDGGTDAEEEAQGTADDGERIGHGGGGIGQIADLLADEDLVGQVVHRSQQGAEDGGDGKLDEKLGDGGKAQGVVPGRPSHGFRGHDRPSFFILVRCPI